MRERWPFGSWLFQGWGARGAEESFDFGEADLDSSASASSIGRRHRRFKRLPRTHFSLVKPYSRAVTAGPLDLLEVRSAARAQVPTPVVARK